MATPRPPGILGNTTRRRRVDGTLVPLQMHYGALPVTPPTPTPPPATATLDATVRSLTTVQLSSGTTARTVATPPGTVAGDLLVAVVSVDAGASAELALPGGFTEAGRVPSSGTDLRMVIGWRVATAGEPVSRSFTIPSTADARVDVLAIRDTDTTKTPVVAVTTTGNSLTTHTASTAFPTTSRNLALWAVAKDDDATAQVWDWKAPAGLAELTDAHANGWVTQAVFTSRWDSGQPIGTRTFTVAQTGGGLASAAVAATILIASSTTPVPAPGGSGGPSEISYPLTTIPSGPEWGYTDANGPMNPADWFNAQPGAWYTDELGPVPAAMGDPEAHSLIFYGEANMTTTASLTHTFASSGTFAFWEAYSIDNGTNTDYISFKINGVEVLRSDNAVGNAGNVRDNDGQHYIQGWTRREFPVVAGQTYTFSWSMYLHPQATGNGPYEMYFLSNIHTVPAAGSSYTPTASGNTTGERSDATAVAFTAAGKTSRYHRWAAHLDPAVAAPLVVHLHGDGAYEYDYPQSWTTPGYVAAGRSVGALVIVPNTPDTVGSRTWWEDPSSAQWLIALIRRQFSDYNLDRRRVFLSGFSGGAVVTTMDLLADYAHDFHGGGAMLLGGGGAYSSAATAPTAATKTDFLLRWHVGELDDGRNTDDNYHARAAAEAGRAVYAAAGWNTTLTLIPGADHLASEPHGPAALTRLILESNTHYGL